MSGTEESQSIVGYRFHPTDEELVDHYLKLKTSGHGAKVSNIPEVEIYKFEPSQLPDFWTTETKDEEWFFFCRRDVKYGRSSQRSNRATRDGFWKPTGKDRKIKSKNGSSIGWKKTLVFYSGRSRNAARTNWVMHEYRSAEKNFQAFVLYFLKKKAEENPDEGVEPSRYAPSPSNQATAMMNIQSGSPSNADWVSLCNNDFASNGQIETKFVAEEPFIEEDPVIQACINSFYEPDLIPEGLHCLLPAKVPNQGPAHADTRYYKASSTCSHGENTIVEDDDSDTPRSILRSCWKEDEEDNEVEEG